MAWIMSIKKLYIIRRDMEMQKALLVSMCLQ